MVDLGAAGSGIRSGVSASRERSSTTATSPSKTPRRALRFHGGSGASVARPDGAPSAFFGSVPDGRFFDGSAFDGFNDSRLDDSFFDVPLLTDSRFSGSLFDDSLSADSLFNGSFVDGSFVDGSFVDGSFVDGSLSSDSRTRAPMIPSTLCWLASQNLCAFARHRSARSQETPNKMEQKKYLMSFGSRSQPDRAKIKPRTVPPKPFDPD